MRTGAGSFVVGGLPVETGMLPWMTIESHRA